MNDEEKEEEYKEPNGVNKDINWIENHFNIVIGLILLLAILIFMIFDHC